MLQLFAILPPDPQQVVSIITAVSLSLCVALDVSIEILEEVQNVREVEVLYDGSGSSSGGGGGEQLALQVSSLLTALLLYILTSLLLVLC